MVSVLFLLISLSVMMSGSIRVGANGFSLFSFVSELQSIVYMYTIFLSIHLSMDVVVASVS